MTVGDSVDALRSLPAPVFLDEGSTRREVSPDELVERAAGEAMRVRTDGAAFDVEGGRVVRVLILEPRLAPLQLDSEQRVVEVFGPAEIVRDHGFVAFHYLERAITVHWDSRRSAPLSVVLGAPLRGLPTFDARDAIRLYVDLEPALESGGARLREDASARERRRLQRLEALLRALGVGSVEDLAGGHFVSATRHAEAIERLERLAPFEPTQRANRDLGAWAFRTLLSYRCKAGAVLRHDDAWAECGFPVLLGTIDVTGRANQAFSEALSEVDELLSLFLDPDRRTLTLAEARRHGWPDVD